MKNIYLPFIALILLFSGLCNAEDYTIDPLYMNKDQYECIVKKHEPSCIKASYLKASILLELFELTTDQKSCFLNLNKKACKNSGFISLDIAERDCLLKGKEAIICEVQTDEKKINRQTWKLIPKKAK